MRSGRTGARYAPGGAKPACGGSTGVAGFGSTGGAECGTIGARIRAAGSACIVGCTASAAIDERTIQLDIYSLIMGEGTQQVVISMWDLAGQAQYAAALQPYIVDGSLYLLTVPALDIPALNAEYGNYLGRWLDYLQTGAPDDLPFGTPAVAEIPTRRLHTNVCDPQFCIESHDQRDLYPANCLE